MKKFMLFVVIGSLLTGLLAACGGKTVKVTENQNGQTIIVKQGDTLSLSIAGNPTTGYSWEVAEVDQNVLVSTGEPNYSSDSDLVGAGGVYTFKFSADKTGTTALKLKYYRSFEPDVEPIQVFEITVIVK